MVDRSSCCRPLHWPFIFRLSWGQEASLTTLTSLRVEVQLADAAATIGFAETSKTEAIEQRLRQDDLVTRGDPQRRVAA